MKLDSSQKNNLLKVLKVIAFLVSGYYTYCFVETLAVTQLQKYVAFFSVIVTEFVGFYAFNQFMKYYYSDDKMKLSTNIIVGTIFFFLSVFSTTFYYFKLSDTQHNEFVNNNSKLAQINDSKNTIKRQIENLETRIKTILTEKTNISADYDKQIAEKPSDWYTVKDNLTKEKNKLLSDKDLIINQLQSKVDKAYSKLSNPSQLAIEQSFEEVNDTAFFPILRRSKDWFNVSEPITESIIVIGYAILFQIGAIYLNVQQYEFKLKEQKKPIDFETKKAEKSQLSKIEQKKPQKFKLKKKSNIV